jgi:hypothetical protein
MEAMEATAATAATATCRASDGGATIDCPDVGLELEEVPPGTEQDVGQDLADLDAQVADAYAQLATEQGDPDEVMASLEEQREATIGDLAEADLASAPRHRAPRPTRPSRSRRFGTVTGLAATAMAGALLVTPCASDEPSSSPYGGEDDEVGAEQPAGEDYSSGDGYGGGYGDGSGASAQLGDPAGELAVAEDAELGEIVRDGEGRTLYRFDNDVAWPMETNCFDDCLDVWKPAAPGPRRPGTVVGGEGRRHQGRRLVLTV